MKKFLTRITNLIYEINGCKVMLDCDLAQLYGVKVKILKNTVKRNLNKFPPDFMFKLTQDEWEFLKTQNDSSKKMKNVQEKKTNLPIVFTEQGVAMLSGLLNSEMAININIQIMRAFVQLRKFSLNQSYRDNEIQELKTMLLLHMENNNNKFRKAHVAIENVVSVLNNLVEKPIKTRKIGFSVED